MQKSRSYQPVPSVVYVVLVLPFTLLFLLFLIVVLAIVFKLLAI